MTIRPPLLRAHHGHDERVQNVVEATEIGIEHAVPRFLAHGWKRRVGMDSRVTHDPVVGSPVLEIALEYFLRRDAVGYVERQERGLPSRGFDHLTGILGIRFPAPEVQRDCVTPCRQRKRDGATDTSTRSRYQDPFGHLRLLAAHMKRNLPVTLRRRMSPGSPEAYRSKQPAPLVRRREHGYLTPPLLARAASQWSPPGTPQERSCVPIIRIVRVNAAPLAT